MLKTKCILAPESENDGLRISIMSRHTLEDGKTPDSRITPNHFDLHLPILAPHPKDVGAYYRWEIDFEEYKKRYLSDLASTVEVQVEVMRLIDMALKQDVTLLCIEDKPDQCHRKLLAEFCQRVERALEISIW